MDREAQVRIQSPGKAYMVLPDGKVSHSNIDVSDTEATFSTCSAIRKKNSMHGIDAITVSPVMIL